jgi:Protein of unknown function (DUF2771)
VRTATGAVALLGGLAVLAGCGGSGGVTETTAPSVTVGIGKDEVEVDPTQYCLSGEGQRYQVTPPTIAVAPDTPILLRVPQAVADAGWSVQVFDEQLQEKIGDVDVDEGTAEFQGISSSDVVPATFYLVVVEDADTDECSGLSGAWPVGFIRAEGGGAPTTPPG